MVTALRETGPMTKPYSGLGHRPQPAATNQQVGPPLKKSLFCIPLRWPLRELLSLRAQTGRFVIGNGQRKGNVRLERKAHCPIYGKSL